MLSHISVLPLLLEWMQGSRSVESMMAHPTNQGERFHKPKEKLYIYLSSG